jgi:3-deoxy-manno-octulosonate cytidylyltransferase (CMP-KDO synthetase)
MREPFWAVIPARYASTRLPGKPLAEIAGQPMIRHVHERAVESGAARVIIATDDQRVFQAARDFGAEVLMTADSHRSGSDRLAEVIERLAPAPETIVVNVQGDEPLLPPALIRQAAEALAAHPQASVATLCEPLRSREEVFNPNIVKAVRDGQGFALYFSRAPIPWLRDTFAGDATALPADTHVRHIGLYAYRAAFVSAFPRLPPCPLEQQESLEQLRVLYHGGKIYLALACAPPGPGVDTPEDLARVRAIVALGFEPV